MTHQSQAFSEGSHTCQTSADTQFRYLRSGPLLPSDPAGTVSRVEAPSPAPEAAARQIRAWAEDLGFHAVGFARAGPADPDGHLRAWLDRGYAGSMDYMARTAAERTDPRRIVPDARSVIALSMSYRRAEDEADADAPIRVARYARSDDYHAVIRKRVRKLRKRMLQAWPGHEIKPTVDTSPVLERAWAERAGIAWTGKSTMAIHPRLGTYTFLATLVTTLELPQDAALPDRCGSCTACLDACPTKAFDGPYVLDATRCIAYWTVETWDPFPAETPELSGWVAGCDICQEVCPWNKFGVQTQEPRFAPRPELSAPDVATFSDPEHHDALQEALRGTPLQRTGAAAVRRSARRALGLAPEPPTEPEDEPPARPPEAPRTGPAEQPIVSPDRSD